MNWGMSEKPFPLPCSKTKIPSSASRSWAKISKGISAKHSSATTTASPSVTSPATSSTNSPEFFLETNEFLLISFVKYYITFSGRLSFIKKKGCIFAL